MVQAQLDVYRLQKPDSPALYIIGRANSDTPFSDLRVITGKDSASVLIGPLVERDSHRCELSIPKRNGGFSRLHHLTLEYDYPELEQVSHGTFHPVERFIAAKELMERLLGVPIAKFHEGPSTLYASLIAHGAKAADYQAPYWDRMRHFEVSLGGLARFVDRNYEMLSAALRPQP